MKCRFMFTIRQCIYCIRICVTWNKIKEFNGNDTMHYGMCINYNLYMVHAMRRNIIIIIVIITKLCHQSECTFGNFFLFISLPYLDMQEQLCQCFYHIQDVKMRYSHEQGKKISLMLTCLWFANEFASEIVKNFSTFLMTTCTYLHGNNIFVTSLCHFYKIKCENVFF